MQATRVRLHFAPAAEWVVAAVFLFRSMTKHMRRVPDRFDDSDVPDDPQSSGPR